MKRKKKIINKKELLTQYFFSLGSIMIIITDLEKKRIKTIII